MFFMFFFIRKSMFLTSMNYTENEEIEEIRSVERGVCPIATLNVSNIQPK